MTWSLFLTVSSVLLSLSAAAASDPIAEPDCRTVLAGILSGKTSNVFKSFYLNDAKQVAFTGNALYNGAHEPLVVQFQACKSLSSVANGGGRLYVPSEGRCVGTTNYAKSTPPYYTKLVKCGTDVSQRFRLASDAGNAIYWIGGTTGNTLQGGCGALGYKSNKAGYPNILHTGSQITLECEEKSPFYLADAAL